jgi:hypothetical protein
MDESIIDKTKFSQEHLAEIFEKQKLATESKRRALLQEKSAVAEKECQLLRASLRQLINKDFYSAILKNEENDSIELTTSYFPLQALGSLFDIKSKCNIDFGAISKELSVATNSKVTVGLYSRQWGNPPYCLNLTTEPKP